jgi:hypothetical protein
MHLPIFNGSYDRPFNDAHRQKGMIVVDRKIIYWLRFHGVPDGRLVHIGNFTNWTDPQAYQIAFDRLLRDLKKTDNED